MLTVNYVLPRNRIRFDYSFIFHTCVGFAQAVLDVLWFRDGLGAALSCVSSEQ